MAIPSVTGLPDNDRDYETVCGNGREQCRSTPAHPLGRELTAAEMNAEVHRILDQVLARIRGLEQSAHRCKHQINLEKSTCGTCLRENGETL